MLTVYYTRWWKRLRFITMFILIIDTTYSHYYWCVYVVYPNMMTIPGAICSLRTRGGGIYARGGKYHTHTHLWFMVQFSGDLGHVQAYYTVHTSKQTKYTLPGIHSTRFQAYTVHASRHTQYTLPGMHSTHFQAYTVHPSWHTQYTLPGIHRTHFQAYTVYTPRHTQYTLPGIPSKHFQA